MIRMIISDMDGTLLDTSKKLPSDFFEVYQLMEAKGVQFVVASGRQYYTLVEEFAHLQHNIAFIAENGGFIKQNGHELVMNPMKAIDAKKLIEAIRKSKGSNVVLCGKNGAYIEDDSSDDFMNEMRKYYVKHEVVSDLLRVEDDILKIAVNNFNDLEENIYPYLKNHFEKQFQISTSSPIWLDIMPKGINKGKAIQLLQKQMHIQPDECMAFGDYLNDYEMLESVEHSYAMANAHADIKKVARYSTDSNDDNGVMNAIRKQLRTNG